MKNDINEKEFFSMINDTSELIKKQQSKNLSSAVIGGINANTTVDTVEFSKYVAGDCPTQPGIDIITQTSILTGDVEGMYQNKAYLSSNNPKKIYMTVFKYRKGKRKWMF